MYSEGARLAGTLVLLVLIAEEEELVLGRPGAEYVGEVFPVGDDFRVVPAGRLYEGDETPDKPEVFRAGLTAVVPLPPAAGNGKEPRRISSRSP